MPVKGDHWVVQPERLLSAAGSCALYPKSKCNCSHVKLSSIVLQSLRWQIKSFRCPGTLLRSTITPESSSTQSFPFYALNHRSPVAWWCATSVRFPEVESPELCTNGRGVSFSSARPLCPPCMKVLAVQLLLCVCVCV